MTKRKTVLFWIFYPLISLLALAFILFYFDLANGPMVLFVLELVALVLGMVFRFLLRNEKFLFRMIPSLSFLLVSVILVSLSKPAIERKRGVSHFTSSTDSSLSLKMVISKVLYSEDQKVEVHSLCQSPGW